MDDCSHSSASFHILERRSDINFNEVLSTFDN